MVYIYLHLVPKKSTGHVGKYTTIVPGFGNEEKNTGGGGRPQRQSSSLKSGKLQVTEMIPEIRRLVASSPRSRLVGGIGLENGGGRVGTWYLRKVLDFFFGKLLDSLGLFWMFGR